MRPRSVDWSLAALVALLGATGLLTLFAGDPANGWVFAAHDVLGFAMVAILLWKVRRVAGRLRPGPGLAALVLVLATLATGLLWSTGGDFFLAGYNALNWHWALGGALLAVVLAHALPRARPLRTVRGSDRRRVLLVGAGALAAWAAQKPAAALVGLRGARRRYTGSYEAGSFQGNAFPTTSWVADDPDPLGAGHRLRAPAGTFAAADLDGDELVATLDCTGGFYSTQRWRGARLDRVLGPEQRASHVQVTSVTGYRWTFPADEAPRLLLATHVGGEPLSHGHGAPVRLVAPGHRGFQWVKWVERVEWHEGPDLGALPSTILSSLT